MVGRTTPEFQSASGQIGLDLAGIKPGEVVAVKTERSRWYFTRTSSSIVTLESVTGIFIQTDSRSFGQNHRSPENTRVRRLIQLGLPVSWSDGRRMTGDVEEIRLNGNLI